MSQTNLPSAARRFVAELPAERRGPAERVLDVVEHHLPPGYEAAITKGMIVYQVPLDRYPDTYNGRPLWYVALASEKSFLSLHLMPIYGDKGLADQLKEGFRAAGKKLNMGKACVRFHEADDLALDVVGEIVAALPMNRWIEIAKAARRR